MAAKWTRLMRFNPSVEMPLSQPMLPQQRTYCEMQNPEELEWEHGPFKTRRKSLFDHWDEKQWQQYKDAAMVPEEMEPEAIELAIPVEDRNWAEWDVSVEGQHDEAAWDVNVEEKSSWAAWIKWGEQKDIDEAIWTEHEDRYERERGLGLQYTGIAPILSDADIILGLESAPPWISSTEE